MVLPQFHSKVCDKEGTASWRAMIEVTMMCVRERQDPFQRRHDRG